MDRPIACFAAIIVLLAINAWVMVWATNSLRNDNERLQTIEGTRFTAKDGDKLRQAIELNRQDTLKNRENLDKLRAELMVNRKIGQEIIDSLKGKKD